MSGTGPATDPQLLEELQFVEQVRAHFRSAGVTLAYWEAYCLSQNSGPALRRAVSRGSGPGERTGAPQVPVEILENLRLLRDRGGPIVSKVRRLVSPRLREGPGSELLEMVLGLLVGSDRGREAVGRWVEDPSRHAQEAGQRIEEMMKWLEPSFRAVRPGAQGSAPTVSSGAALAAAPDLPPGVAPPSGSSLAPAEIMIASPGIPEGLAANASAGRVALEWIPVPSSTGYNVKRANGPGSPFLTIGTPRECRFIDEKAAPGSSYLYRVSASNEAGEGGDGAVVPVAVPLPAPRPPAGLKLVAGAHRIDLTWEAEPGCLAYHVRRQVGASPERSTVARVEGPAYSDRAVKPATTYGYAVSAIGPGGESPDGGFVVASTPAALAAPGALEASGGDRHVALKWHPVPGATEYVVSRSAGGESPLAPVGRTRGTSLRDAGLKNGTSYTYAVRAVRAEEEGTESARVVAAPVAPPAAPARLAISGDGHRFWLSWSPVPGARHYHVKRGVAPGGPYERILSGLKLVSQEDAPPSRGIPYYYVVSAVGPGGEGPPSQEVSLALPALPAPPAELRATPGHGSIVLEWSSSAGSSIYHVKRRVGPQAKYVTIASPTDTSYVDTAVTGATRYEYVVSAVTGSLEGADSAPVKAECLVTPAAPTGLSALPSDGRVTLSWNPVSGVQEYRLRRATVREGLFSEIARIRGATSHADHTVTNGVAYDYVVVAVNAGGESPTSARSRATPASAPSKPRALEGSAGQGRVLLTWAGAPEATSFVVKRATSAEGPFLEIASVAQTTYTDVAVVNGSSFYYKVCAVNAGGRSEDAGPLSATPVEFPATPDRLAGDPAPGAVSLSWSPVPGATSYVVKRSTAPQGPFTTLATLSETSLLDRDVHPGTVQYYLVLAVNSAGRSAPSSIVGVTPHPRA